MNYKLRPNPTDQLTFYLLVKKTDATNNSKTYSEKFTDLKGQDKKKYKQEVQREGLERIRLHNTVLEACAVISAEL